MSSPQASDHTHGKGLRKRIILEVLEPSPDLRGVDCNSDWIVESVPTGQETGRLRGILRHPQMVHQPHPTIGTEWQMHFSDGSDYEFRFVCYKAEVTAWIPKYRS